MCGCHVDISCSHLARAAYANDQHNMHVEIIEDQPLEMTSFFRAMHHPKCRGTIAVVDPTGTYFTRIWCVFELYHSLGGTTMMYTYDMVRSART